jgi:hypothetical protein
MRHMQILWSILITVLAGLNLEPLSHNCECKKDICSPKVVVLLVEPVVTVLTIASVLMADELRDELLSIVIVELYER